MVVGTNVVLGGSIACGDAKSSYAPKPAPELIGRGANWGGGAPKVGKLENPGLLVSISEFESKLIDIQLIIAFSVIVKKNC